MKKILGWFVVTLVLTIISAANVPAPFFGGYAGFEPLGLENVKVLRETISIDMLDLGTYRNYSDENAVKLEILFEVENTQAEKQIELEFPHARDLKIFVDDTEISTVSEEKKYEITASVWKVPTKTAWFEGKQLDYNGMVRSNEGKNVVYKFKLPNGRHRVKIMQNLSPSSNVTGALTKYWQFSYVFLQAEKRVGITKTDIEIKTPPNWETSISPDVASSEGVWQKSFDKISDTSVTITTKLPKPEGYTKIKDLSDYLFFFALFIFPVIGLFFNFFWLSKTKFWWLWGIIFTILWTLLVAVSVYISEFMPENAIPEAQQLNYGYEGIGSIIAIIFMSVIPLILGFTLWLLVWFIRGLIWKKNTENKP